MAVVCEVAGDDLVVTRDRKKIRLSLSVPLEQLSIWLEIKTDAGFWDTHRIIRDEVLSGDDRVLIEAIEKVDAVDAVQVVEAWSQAISARLGKALSASSSGETTGQSSPATSGSDSELSSTE